MKKEIKWGIILQYFQIITSIIVNLIYTPIMLRTLGSTEYGIYNIATSILSCLGLLTLGFNSSYIKFYSKYVNKEEEINKLNGMYLLTFFFLGSIALVSGLIISSNIQIFMNDSYSIYEITVAKKLMMILSINLFFSFLTNVYVSFINSHEKFIFLKVVNLFKSILNPAVSILFLLNGYGSIGIVIATTIFSLLVDTIYILYSYVKLKIKFCFKNMRLDILKNIAVFSFFIAINQIIDQVNWQVDKIIIGKEITGEAVAIYSLAATINTIYIQFSTSIASVFTPKIHKIIEDNIDVDKRINTLFLSVGKLQWFILMMVLLGFVFFGKYFIILWVGEEMLDVYNIVLLLIIPITIPLCQNLGIEIQRAKNKQAFRSVVYLIMAVINVILSIILCKKYGIIGCALGTAISLIVANIIIMNIYYHQSIKIRIDLFWKMIIFSTPSFIVPCIFGIIIMFTINFSNILMYLIFIFIFVLVYIFSVYLFGMNKKERKQIITYIFNNGGQ